MFAGDLIGELVGGDLQNRLTGLDRVALLLEPLGDGALFHGQPQLGHENFKSHMLPSLLVEHALDRGDDIIRMGEVLILQHRAEGRDDVQTAHSFHRCIQLVQQLFGDLRGELTGIAATLDLFGDDDGVDGSWRRTP